MSNGDSSSVDGKIMHVWNLLRPNLEYRLRLRFMFIGESTILRVFKGHLSQYTWFEEYSIVKNLSYSNRGTLLEVFIKIETIITDLVIARLLGLFERAPELELFFCLKETVDTKTPEPDIYRKITKLSHDTHASTVQLLHDIADIQKHGAEVAIADIQEMQSQNLSNTIDPKAVPLLQQIITISDGIHTALNNLTTSLNLNTNYVKNVRNYSQTVKESYDTFQLSKTGVIVKLKQPVQEFLLIIATTKALVPCFYKMELITRYPLIEFLYDNLDILANQKQACKQIAEILDTLFTVLKPYLTKYPP
jgi:hypothetical protein